MGAILGSLHSTPAYFGPQIFLFGPPRITSYTCRNYTADTHLQRVVDNRTCIGHALRPLSSLRTPLFIREALDKAEMIMTTPVPSSLMPVRGRKGTSSRRTRILHTPISPITLRKTRIRKQKAPCEHMFPPILSSYSTTSALGVLYRGLRGLEVFCRTT